MTDNIDDWFRQYADDFINLDEAKQLLSTAIDGIIGEDEPTIVGIARVMNHKAVDNNKLRATQRQRKAEFFGDNHNGTI
jgi:hypothetical protein